MALAEPAKILLVEGDDDRHFVRHVCRAHGVDMGFDTRNCEGRAKLLSRLTTEADAPDRQALGVIVDADEDAAATWQAIGDRLAAFYPELPRGPAPGGAIVEATDLPRLGVWIMPDNLSAGMLETLMGRLLDAAEDDLWPLACEAVALVPAERRRFRPVHEVKAIVHTWLAWQEQPGHQLARTVVRHAPIPAVATEDELAARFASWLRRLFA